MSTTKVLLLFGGESSEHDVSISSARNVYAAIDDDKFDVKLCFIDKQGKWWLLDTFDLHISTHDAPQLLPALGGRGFVTVPEHNIIKPDVIFPVLHGKGGEDGSVQGLAQLLHIPIVGCDVTASSIGMDKVAAKEVAQIHDIKVVPYVTHHAGDPLPDFGRLSLSLGNPLFVKPSRAGSSVGVSKVHSNNEFARAVDDALEHDGVVLIEKAIAGRELEVAMLGTPPNHQASDVGEIIPGEDFYSYEDKYASGSKAIAKVPAEISDDVREKVQASAKRVYQAIGCSGLSRIDFFLDQNGEVYFNEINTMPGFTNISMYPKLWRHQGISYPQLIEELINDTLTNGTIKAA